MNILGVNLKPGMIFKNDNIVIEIKEVTQRPTCDFPYVEDTETPITAVVYDINGEQKVDTAIYLATIIVSNNFK